MLHWDDMRYFLAVARAGSTAGGGRLLGVNATTVARRIAALEAAVGAQLFDRSRDGYVLRADAQALLQAAEAAETEAQAFAERAAALARGVDRLRVTTNEPLANAIVAPAIVAFQTEHPEVRIDLVIGPQQLDLDRGEADVALRAAPDPGPGDLVVRRVADAHWAVYCSRAYAERQGRPAGVTDLAGHTILATGEPSSMRLAQQAPDVRCEQRETMNELVVALRAGQGIASLPCIIGDPHADFVRCFAQDEPVTPVWLICHQRLRRTPPVRRFLDLVAEHTLAARPILHGREG
jgi:DNA-binding transcriptional LysR family regulator